MKNTVAFVLGKISPIGHLSQFGYGFSLYKSIPVADIEAIRILIFTRGGGFVLFCVLVYLFCVGRAIL